MEGKAVGMLENRCGAANADTGGMEWTGSAAWGETLIAKRGRIGSLSPSGPVGMLRVCKIAFLTLAEGPVTMNSARAPGGSRMSFLEIRLAPGAPVCDPVGTPSSAAITSVW